MDIIQLLKVIVLGIVEGLTEWLPISSTTHIKLVDDIIKFNATESFKEVFIVFIQLGPMLAVAITYFQKLNPFDPAKNSPKKKASFVLWLKIIIAALPAAILGVLLDDWIDAHFSSTLINSLMLIIYGLIFIVYENINRNKQPEITKTGQIGYQTALYIGMCQVLALIPGTSRSGVTILGAMMLGCSRSISVEFSFLIGIPILFGAGVLKLLKYALSIQFHFDLLEIVYLLTGCLVSFIVAAYTISYFLNWIKKHNFKPFGYYRIALGIVNLIWFGLRALVK